MWLYDVSKPTKLQLVREVKSGDSGIYKRIEKKSRSFKASDNLKIWLTSFFETILIILYFRCFSELSISTLFDLQEISKKLSKVKQTITILLLLIIGNINYTTRKLLLNFNR